MTDESIDVAAFAAAFQRFLDHLGDLAPERRSPLHERAVTHLGVEPDGLPSLMERFPRSEHANLQLALDAELGDPSGWELIGLHTEVRHYGGFSLSSLLSGQMMGPHFGPTAPTFTNQPIGVDDTLPCIELGLFLATFDGAPIAALVGVGEEHGPAPGLVVEVVSPDRDACGRFLQRIRALMDELNVYRGKVLAFAYTEYGGFGITFHRVPRLTRDDVILPEADLAAIEQHTIAVSAHADALRAAGRHLKRGLLLFGPPGTGKTLSVMYLCNELAGRTTLLLSGVASGALGQAVAIARSLQPSMVVLEDVDLVAMERTMPGMGSNPLLFQLLNEMDGLGEDADVIFVLTTNRVELLEPALAARPGRIDQAVEIRLPDSPSRARLFELYLRGTDHQVVAGAELDALVERTEGVSAAFIKELVRRAVLAGLTDGGGPLSTARLDAALTALLERSAPVLRSTLGANPGIAQEGPFGDEGGFHAPFPSDWQ